MTTPSLTKSADEGLWETANYVMFPNEAQAGYELVNRETGQVEMVVDQEPQACMAMLWLQEQYEEIMSDPEREFIRRKHRGGNTTSLKSVH